MSEHVRQSTVYIREENAHIRETTAYILGDLRNADLLRPYAQVTNLALGRRKLPANRTLQNRAEPYQNRSGKGV